LGPVITGSGGRRRGRDKHHAYVEEAAQAPNLARSPRRHTCFGCVPGLDWIKKAAEIAEATN
ncbi:MAG: hypothetical protein ACKVH1_03340, partial [Alphaproteobacteria bacterium]